jgi:hypothetical protein
MIITKIVQATRSGKFDSLALQAVSQAIAKQKAMGLNHYSHRNGHIVARNAKGQFISLKENKP